MTELHGLKVLVVEDEMLIAAEMEATLEDLGCQVVGPFGRVAQGGECNPPLILSMSNDDENYTVELYFPSL